MKDKFYPCVFIMNDYSERDKDLDHIAYYRFKSSKSNLYYIVRVEVYRKHVYGVKFYLKKMNFSPKKYSFLTNTSEPRTIIYTIFNLMREILLIQNSVTNEFFSRFLLEDTHIEGSETQINLNRY